jgi:hypothetical protein
VPICWNIDRIPELTGLTEEERGRFWLHVVRKSFRHWQTWAGLIACGACTALGSVVGAKLGSGLLGAAAGGGIGGLLYGQALVYVARRYYADAVLRGHAS